MKNESKNNIFYVVLLILTFITMVIGVTFTYYSLMAKEDEDSTRVQTGLLSINYIDGREVDTYALLPISEPTINSTYSVYKKEFSVSSSGTLDQTLDIYMTIKENNFANNSLKYALYDSANTKVSSGYIPSGNEREVLMKSGIPLGSTETKKFTVLVWLDENNQEQDNMQGKTFTGGFNIVANQLKYE